MKKISLFFTAVLMFTVASAQNDRTNFGLKAGLNIANFSTEETENTDSKLGAYAGVLAHIHVSPKFAVQPELVYSTQGMKHEDVKFLLDYLNLPVMVQYMFADGFRIETGPQIGLLTRAKYDFNDEEVDAKADFKKTDISWGFGLNYLTSSGIGIGARYNLGLSDINDSDLPQPDVVKNRVFQVGLFMMFDNRHKAKSR